jgi:hypothetical protein
MNSLGFPHPSSRMQGKGISLKPVDIEVLVHKNDIVL